MKTLKSGIFSKLIWWREREEFHLRTSYKMFISYLHKMNIYHTKLYWILFISTHPISTLLSWCMCSDSLRLHQCVPITSGFYLDSFNWGTGGHLQEEVSRRRVSLSYYPNHPPDWVAWDDCASNNQGQEFRPKNSQYCHANVAGPWRTTFLVWSLNPVLFFENSSFTKYTQLNVSVSSFSW